jgi:hypothetical protein
MTESSIFAIVVSVVVSFAFGLSVGLIIAKHARNDSEKE